MPFITLGTTAQLQIKVPTRGTTGWDETMRTDTFLKIATHDHSGSNGKGVQLGTGALAADSVTGAKIRLDNDEYLRGRNAGNSADINIIKVDTNDELVVGATVASIELQDDGLTIVDNADNTKVLAVDVSGVTTATTRTLTVPDASGIIVLNDNTATLTNKTLTSPIISTISNTGTVTLPTATTTLVGRDTTDTLTNKTIDADSNTITNIENADIKAAAAIALDKLAATTASRALVSDGSGFISVSATTATELGYVNGVTSAIQTQIDTKTDTGTADEITLTGTTIGLADNPILPGTGSVTLPKGTTAQRSGTPASGMFRFNTSNSQFEGYDGTAWGEIGGGSAGINFITNSDFEAGVTDWNTYADAAGENAVDGTGGTANITFTQNSTSPLRDSADGKLSKDAANRQGEGVSFDFSIDNTDKSSMIKISFDYSTTTNYADGDVRVQIQDVTNSNLIRLAPEDLPAVANNGKFVTSFQAAADSTSYRLILHISSTNATAYDVHIDNVVVTPNHVSSVSAIPGPIEDIRSSSFAGAGNTGTFLTCNVVQGKRYLVTGQLDIDYADNTTEEYDIETGAGTLLGRVTVKLDLSANPDTYTETFAYVVDAVDSGTIVVQRNLGAAGGIRGNGTKQQTFLSCQQLSENESSGSLSGRKIAARADTLHATSCSSGSSYYVAYTNADYDFTGSQTVGTAGTTTSNSTGWKYSVPESGLYDISALLAFSPASSFTENEQYRLSIYVNGSEVTQEQKASLGTTTNVAIGITVSDTLDLVSGDRIEIVFYQLSGSTISLDSTATRGNVTVKKIQAPSEVLPSEKIKAKYYDTAVAYSSGSFQPILFENKSYDTHNAVYTGGSPSYFECPRSGFLKVRFKWQWDTATWAAGNKHELAIYQGANGTSSDTLVYAYESLIPEGASSGRREMVSEFTVEATKGDRISVYIFQNSGSSKNSRGGEAYNFVEFEMD